MTQQYHTHVLPAPRAWSSGVERRMRGGTPSTTQPTPPPWLSPKVVTRNAVPNVLARARTRRRVPLAGRRRGGGAAVCLVVDLCCGGPAAPRKQLPSRDAVALIIHTQLPGSRAAGSLLNRHSGVGRGSLWVATGHVSSEEVRCQKRV
jgi:hypothetical protein